MFSARNTIKQPSATLEGDYFLEAKNTLAFINQLHVDKKPIYDLVVADGFKFWTFIQDYIFWELLVPYYKNASAPTTQQPSKKCYKLFVLTYSLLSFAYFILRKPKLLIYTIDNVKGKERCDFRLSHLYQEITKRKLPYVEFIHSANLGKSFKNIFRRRRPAIYFESFAFIGKWISKSQKNLKLPHTGDPDLDTLLLLALKRAQHMKNVYSANKALLRLLAPKASLLLDDSRHVHSLVASSKHLGITAVQFQHAPNQNEFNVGFSLPGIAESFSHTASYYGFWSDYFRNKFLHMSNLYTKENTFVSGPLKEIKHFSHSRTAKQKRVLFISEPRTNKEELTNYYVELEHLFGFEKIIKLRPDELIDDFKIKFPAAQRYFDMFSTQDIADEIIASDVVVGCSSSALFEALFYLKPIVILDCKLSPFSLRYLEKENLASCASSPSKLQKTILEAIEIEKSELLRRREVVWGNSPQHGALEILAKIENL